MTKQNPTRKPTPKKKRVEPYRDPHILNTIEFTGETYEECERRLIDEDDLPGHRG